MVWFAQALLISKSIMTNKNAELWKNYIAWCLLPADEKKHIVTDTDWCRTHEVSDRTLRRWKQHPDFVAMYDAAVESGVISELVKKAESPVDDDDVAEGDEADYRDVKAVLLKGARGGNPKYVEMYLKTYGKPFIDEEVASRSSDLSGMDLDDLVARTVLALAPEELERVLVEAGWQARRPVS